MQCDPVTGPVWSRGWVEVWLYSSTNAVLEGVSGQQHAPATLYPGKDPVPILQEAGWTPGPVWTGRKSRPHRDLIPDCPARSQSLYRLSYPAHQASYAVGIGLFPEIKRPGRGVNHPPPSSAEVKERVELYFFLWAIMVCSVMNFTLDCPAF